MRFRAVAQGTTNVQNLSNVVGTVAKLAKMCILRINSTKLFFILSERILQGGTQMWCEIPKTSFFSQYDVDGVSQEHNEIYLELAAESLSKAFKSTQAARVVKMKLTKKATPCITLEVDLPSASGYNRTIVHDIPAKVLPTKLWGDYQQPATGHFDVSLYLPPMKVLKNVVDRMKNLSSGVIISANRNGELVLKIETDMVNVSTFFKGLIQPIWEGSDGADGAQQSGRAPVDGDRVRDFTSIQVDIKKLAQFLVAQQISTDRVVLNLVSDQTAQLIVLYDNVVIQYVIPAVAVS